VAAWGARGLEALFAMALAVNRVNLSGELALVVALIVTGVMSYLGHAVADYVCRADRPHLSEHLAKRGVLISGLIVVLALIPVVAARTIDAVAVFVDPGLVILTFALPLLAGFLAVVASLLGWSQRFADRHRQLLVEQSETEQFARELRIFLAPGVKPSVLRPARGQDGPGPIAGIH
jgi:hypothetical protein